MSDKELLEFCKQHKVKLSVSYEANTNGYLLQMERGLLRINYIISSNVVATAIAWDAIVKSKLNELEESLTRMERVEEKKKEHIS